MKVFYIILSRYFHIYPVYEWWSDLFWFKEMKHLFWHWGCILKSVFCQEPTIKQPRSILFSAVTHSVCLCLFFSLAVRMSATISSSLSPTSAFGVFSLSLFPPQRSWLRCTWPSGTTAIRRSSYRCSLCHFDLLWWMSAPNKIDGVWWGKWTDGGGGDTSGQEMSQN